MKSILDDAQHWHWQRMEARTFNPNRPAAGIDSHEGEYSTCWCCCPVCQIYNPYYTKAHQWTETWGEEEQ